MSGPVQTPLKVTEVDGSPSGRPITEIVVSNSDLSISGVVATVDTSGTATTPGGADSNVQYNDGGAFGGSADFTFTEEGADIPKFNILSSTTANKGIYSSQSITLDGGTGLPTITTTDGDDGLYLTTGSDGADGPLLILTSSDGAATPHLSLRNGATDGTITIDTTVGTGDITVNANGDLNLYGGSDSVVLRHQSGGAVNVQSASDTAAILQVKTDGTGTSQLNLLDDSKSITLQCDTNQKLKIDGGSYNFIFDASGAATGITWPDGSIQTTAASGGGGIVLAPAEDVDTSYDVNYITSQAPYGNCTASTFYFSRNEPFYFPFLAPSTGNLAGIVMEVTGAAGSACNLEVAVYEDSSGLPGAMLGKATFDVTSAAQLTQTSFTDDGGGATTIPTVANQQLWIGYVRSADVDFTVRAISTANAAAIGPTENLSSSWTILWEFDTHANDLPATVTKTDLSPRAYDRMSVGLEYD